MSASGSAKSRMERIMRLHDQIDEIKADIREVYAEEKGDGGDKTAMGAAISVIRKRAKDKDAFDEREALAAVYLNAYNGASHTHAREASQSYAEAKGRNAGSSSGRTAEFDSANAGSNPAPVTSTELTDTQEQPETVDAIQAPKARPEVVAKSTAHIDTPASEKSLDEERSESDSSGGMQDEEAIHPAAHSPSPDAAPRLATADDEAAQANPIVVGNSSNPQPSSLGAVMAPEADSLPASGAALSEDGLDPSKLTFLTQGETKRKTAADYRGDDCQHPDACGSTDPFGLCYQCRRDMEAASETEAA